MVVAENSSGDCASIPVADVVFVVEGTANLGAYIDIIKQSYILPTLEYFNGGPPDSTDYGCDYSCTLYDLITFYSGDIAPGPASTCTEPTTSTHDVITWLDSMPFVGGCGEYFSHMAEGLSTALQVFDDLSSLRKHSQASQKHCILVCNSSPYMLPAQESLRYSGMTCEQIVTTMTKKGVHFTIISPRKIPSLQRLFEEAYSAELGVTPLKDYSTDPRHLVLLHGYQLQERSQSPSLEDDKQTTDMLKATISAAHSPAASGASKVHSPAAAVLANDEQGKFKVPATVPSSIGAQSSLSQPSSYSQQPSPTMSQHSPAGVQQPSPQQTQPITSNPQIPISHPQVSQNPNSGLSSLPTGQSSDFQQSSPQDPFSKASVRMPTTQSRLPQTAQGELMHHPGLSMGPRPTGQQNIGLQNRPPNPNQLSQAPPQQQATSVSQQQITSMQTDSMSSATSQMGQKTLPNYSQSISHPTSTIAQNIPQQQPGGGMTSNPQGFMNQQPSLPIGNTGDVTAGQDMGGSGDVMSQGGVPASQQTLAQLGHRKIIWQGHVEWQEKPRPQVPAAMNQQRVQKALACTVTIGPGDPEINARNWPNRLLMQHIPQHLLKQLEHLFRNARQVAFHFANSDLDALKNLYRLMGTGFAGCVHFQSSAQCDVKVLLLVFSNKKRAFIGLIPNDQSAFVLGIRQVITQHKNKPDVCDCDGLDDTQQRTQNSLQGQYVPQPGMAASQALSTQLQIQQPPMGSMPNAGMPSSTATSTMGMSASEASNNLNLQGKQMNMASSGDQMPAGQMSTQMPRPQLASGQMPMGGGQQIIGQQPQQQQPQQQQQQQQQQQIALSQLTNATTSAASGAPVSGQTAIQQERERIANLQKIKELQESLQRAHEKELVFRQSDSIEPTPTSQPPHQVMAQQAQPRQITAQQHQLQQQQRLQLQQQQQQQQQQQSSNQQQLRHILLSQQQQQQLHARQQLLLQQQQQQQQQQRGPGPQSQHGMVPQHQLVQNQMSSMPSQGGQNFMDDFNLTDM